MRITAYCIAVLLLLSGCASPPAPLATPSGRPEVLIHASPERVKSAIIAAEVGAGSRLESQSENSLSFTAPSKSFATNMLYGTQFAPIPYGRATYTLVPESHGVRVFVAGEIISNYGSAFQNAASVDVTQSRIAFQNLLKRIKATAEKS